jgi:mRNA-degrading endonuclease RelE of RelBE toxin-antitoxin system
MFEVFFDIPAQDFMKDADENTHSRVKETLEELALDPVPLGAKRIIENQEKIFRFRSRHLKFLYRIDYEKRTLIVIKIEPLSRMYR